MKNIYFLLALLFIMPFDSLSQTKEELAPCGTVSHRSDWLKAYQQNPQSYRSRTDTTIYVPLTIHLLGNDDGSGYFSMNSLLTALCVLNEDYAAADIEFYIEGDIRYINSTAWNNHETVLEGAEMMFANNVENTLNCYFVLDPAGNCGYNLPYAGLANAKSCSGPNDHTWSHEVGHALSLPHPFLGWEGGVSHDNSVAHSYNNPAPETVLFDYTYFKDTLILDTMIIDTAFVEKMDGSNCHFAADGFCDTAPDYLSSRWPCDANDQSNTIQTDPNGETFISDGTLFMSYANDNCASRFSDEQILAMRANLLDEKANLLYNQFSIPEPDGLANLQYPIEGELVHFESVNLEWEAVPEATNYTVTLYRVILGSTFVEFGRYATNTNSINLGELSVDKEFAWEVKAFNSHHFCAPVSEQALFRTANINSTKQMEGLQSFTVQPTVFSNGANLQVSITLEKPMDLNLVLVDLLGKRHFEEQITNANLQEYRTVELPELPKGIYMIGLENRIGRVFKKLVVQ